ncbi:MAG TPA: DUF2252 domain-containing protein [Jatrophihabitans sp.]|nr:DUF2252 domain-containing protein [Jatrophihabitans sp.]
MTRVKEPPTRRAATQRRTASASPAQPPVVERAARRARTTPRPLSVPERRLRGEAARDALPLEQQGAYEPAPNRRDPVAILQGQEVSRVPELVPIRHGRMLVSPFTFYRGAAAVMAADLAARPVSGITVQLCGDAHVSNFGLFGSPERALLFDINDFDETHPGPWEWDVKRLVASLAIAGRDNGFGGKERRGIVRACARRYREAMREFAEQRELDVWYARLDTDNVQQLVSEPLTKSQIRKVDKLAAKARTRDSMQAFAKLTHEVDGHPRIIATPPLVVPIGDLLPEADRATLITALTGLLRSYRRTLPSDRRVLLDRYTFIDMARKVVGVGSVGTRCWIVLMEGRDGMDPLFLQVKEAQPSVLAEHLATGGLPLFRNQGERVVAGQRLMQAASDIFLGWQSVEGIDGEQRDFYVRQLRDWKGSVDIENTAPKGLSGLGEMCGWTLARAHARSGDRIAIATYLGEDEAFEQAMVAFADSYAEQNERDYAALAEAVRTGRVEAESGI